MKRILKLVEDKRSASLNMALGAVCAFVAGAVNAGGFLVVKHYTSHITGQVASGSDALVLGHYSIFQNACFFVGCFFLGACCASVFIQTARLLKLHSQYALSLLVSGLVLMGLGVLSIHNHQLSDFLLLGLFFSMGMQNATVSELSHSEVRATHMTGVVTDLGLELGKWLLSKNYSFGRFRFLILIFLSFFCGGLAGAYSFAQLWGLSSLIVFGGILAFLSLFPVSRDIHIRFRYFKQHQ